MPKDNGRHCLFVETDGCFAKGDTRDSEAINMINAECKSQNIYGVQEEARAQSESRDADIDRKTIVSHSSRDVGMLS